jgi:hypothetical protein
VRHPYAHRRRFGPTASGKNTYAADLIRSLRAGMMVLADRNFAAAALIAAIARTKADVLVREERPRPPGAAPLRRRLVPVPDGPTRFRVIEAQITIATSAGRRTGIYRLATTLLDHRDCPAADLIMLYHQRWEIETPTWN